MSGGGARSGANSSQSRTALSAASSKSVKSIDVEMEVRGRRY
jgi:hypothetical protein